MGGTMAEMNPIDHPSLVGIGIYTAAEARRYTGVASSRIRRWLSGHQIKDRTYQRLWRPQIELDDSVYLGFRDLTEVRVVAAFIDAGLSPQKVRRAIEIARERYGLERPLSTNDFRTDGGSIFLILAEEGDDRVVNVFTSQFEIKNVVEPSFKGFQFSASGEPIRWQISKGVVLDPERSFGQPIEESSSVPTYVLANAVKSEGSIKGAAAAYRVSVGAVRNAMAFESQIAA